LQKIFYRQEDTGTGIQIEPIDKAMAEAGKLHGYFILLSNKVKDPVAALELYRTRDVVEKAFGNLKERLNCRRTLVSSDQSLDGKIFVEFIALYIFPTSRKR